MNTNRHCNLFSGPAKYVLLGEMDYSGENDDAQPVKLNIVERIKHPEYTSRLKYNDIALLQLENDVIFNEYIRPACLPRRPLVGDKLMHLIQIVHIFLKLISVYSCIKIVMRSIKNSTIAKLTMALLMILRFVPVQPQIVRTRVW